MRLFILVVLVFSLVIFSSEGMASSCSKQCNFVKSIEMRACNDEYKLCKEDCEDGVCKRECVAEKNRCLKYSKSEAMLCSKRCAIEGKNITCMNGTYFPGETFLNGCESCFCDFKGKVKCTTSQFCNFQDVSYSQNECAEGGGFYHALCNGPYFDIVCSKEKYCLCSGKNNYSCSEDSYCVQDFVSPNRRKNTIPGWKTLLGFELGEIGVCAKLPEIESCGNGVCDNVLCSGCEYAETKYNCPSDCF